MEESVSGEEEEILMNWSQDADFATGTFGVFPMVINISKSCIISAIF